MGSRRVSGRIGGGEFRAQRPCARPAFKAATFDGSRGKQCPTSSVAGWAAGAGEALGACEGGEEALRMSTPRGRQMGWEKTLAPLLAQSGTSEDGAGGRRRVQRGFQGNL